MKNMKIFSYKILLSFPVLYVMFYAVRPYLARIHKLFLSLQMQNNLLEVVDDGGGFRCRVLLEDRDK
jgi:hypothetical protein